MAGCQSPPVTGASDAEIATDGGSTQGDAGPPQADAGPTTPGDAAVAPRDGGSSPADVARCESTAAMVATACNGQVDRTCEHTEGARFCGRERADVLADAYDCLLALSHGSCRTFSDPSGAEVCLSGVASANDVTHAQAVASTIAAVCPTVSADLLLTRAILPLMTLSDATLDHLSACVAAAGDCDGALLCYRAEVPTIVACYP